MIFRSPFPEVSIPETTLTETVFRKVNEHGDKPAIIDGVSGRVLTYSRLFEDVRRAATGLSARGLKKGDVLALLSPNVPEYAVAFHATTLLGGAVTPINPLCTEKEIREQLRDAGAKYLVASPSLAGKAASTIDGTSVTDLFVFGAEAGGAKPFSALLEHEPDPPRVEIDPREDVAALPYSSGTTGVSKGVMLTHHNMVANLAQIEGTDHARNDDTLIGVLPLFHIYGMQVIMNFSLYIGATVVMLPRFDLEETLGAMQKYGVTLAHFVPPIMLALAKHPSVDNYDLSKLHTIFSAAAPLGREVAEAVASRLNCLVKQGYGMTEASPATHMIPHDARRNRPGSVGLAVPNMECKVVDVETGEEMEAGSEGEICVRGPQVMKGYLNRPDATALTIDSEGWLHTGDIGYADEDGFFFIVDRAKELIKYKGYQVAPAELEALLVSHPAVADAAVVPSPDEEAGEVPKAFVVVKDGASLTPGEVMEFVASQVGPHKRIRRVEFTTEIPKSPSGKILRRILIARERAESKPV